MTAQIAILNKIAVALASDSAVTINKGKKVYNSANKLFCLSKYYPVGIMIYGNAEFMEVPWETIIKLFRKELNTNQLPKLENYAQKFIQFLKSNKLKISLKEQDRYLDLIVVSIFSEIKEKILKNIKEEFNKKKNLTESQIMSIINSIIHGYNKEFSKKDELTCYPKNFKANIRKKINKIFKKYLSEIFQKLPLSKLLKRKLNEIIILAITRDIFPSWHSGLVIAGFGEDEIFPSLRAYTVEALINGKLKFTEDKGMRTNVDVEMRSAIRPFAQVDMVYTFMEGIDPQYRANKRRYLKEIFENYPSVLINNLKEFKKLTKIKKRKIETNLKKVGKDFVKDYVKNMTEYSRNKFVDPILDVVEVLPKDELASMAESLVNITSFRRKISLSMETVGGPIDVAVISKGDWFIWIKRKHYFESEKNPQFLNNYNRGVDLNEKRK